MNKYPELCDALDRLAADGMPEQLPNEVVNALANVWGSLRGSRDHGMHASKLSPMRIEQPAWTRPILTFRIERHGGTMMGSTRADIHEWTVDLAQGTASARKVSYRQLIPTDKRMNTKALAEEAFEAIRQNEDAPYLKWSRDRRTVRIAIGVIIPDTVRQTTAARRRRFRTALDEKLKAAGWTQLGLYKYTAPEA